MKKTCPQKKKKNACWKGSDKKPAERGNMPFFEKRGGTLDGGKRRPAEKKLRKTRQKGKRTWGFQEVEKKKNLGKSPFAEKGKEKDPREGWG